MSLFLTSSIFSYCPTAVASAIYGGISGAQYSDTLQQWIVPCDSEIDMAIQIECASYERFPISSLI